MKKLKQLIAFLVVALCLITTVSDTVLPVSVYAVSATETAKKINVKNLKIKLSKTTLTYNGKEQKPKVTVTYKGKNLKSENYTVKYSSGRKLPGTYKVTVTLKGNYTGKKTLKYKIELKAPTVKVSKTAVNQATLKWSKTTKATGYIIYDSDKEKIASTKKTSYTLKNLESGSKNTFYVRSYTKLKNKTYYSKYVKVTVTSAPLITGANVLYIGDTYTYKAKADGKVSWSVDDEEIAEITSKGKLTAYDEGIVKIKAKANGVSSYFNVTVKTPIIKLNNSYISINKGNSAKLIATIVPSQMEVEWGTDNSSVVAVSSDGQITANSPGTATIKATGYYQDYTYEDYCVVTVVEVPTTVPSTTAPTEPPTTPTTVPTTQPTTIPTTTPTTSTPTPTEPSTTAPTTVPTTQPTTIPTTVPSTTAPTEPSTVPTTVPSTTAPTEPTSIPTTTAPPTVPSTTTPTEPPIEKSAFDVLKNYILEHGYTNSDGNKFIIRNTTNNNTYYSSAIVYNNATEKMIFIASVESNNPTRIDIALSFELSEINAATIVEGIVLYYYNNELYGSGAASAVLQTRTYTSNTTLNFYWEPTSTELVKNSDTLNSVTSWAMSDWNVLLLTTCDITLNDLGFVSY